MRIIDNCIVKRIISDRTYKIMLFAIITFFVNLMFGLYNGVLGVMSGSVWFKSMCAYYIILGIMRLACFLSSRRGNVCFEYFVMGLMGVVFLLLITSMSTVMYISLFYREPVQYGTIPMITIATYTFYKIVIAVMRAVKNKKRASPCVKAASCIGYAEVSASVMSMQSSMIATFPGMTREEAFIMNGLTSIGVLAFVLILGIYMIKKGFEGYVKIKKSKCK